MQHGHMGGTWQPASEKAACPAWLCANGGSLYLKKKNGMLCACNMAWLNEKLCLA